jgi:acyl-CoA reductase-like NAD-dependent aldehyde dehydrogenase
MIIIGSIRLRPGGGFKNTGVGRETGIESFDQFSAPRAVSVNTSAVTVDWYADDGQLKRLNQE